MEILETIEENPAGIKPSHYDIGIDVAQVQELVAQNVLNATLDSKKALWVASALKHLLRIGLKDEVDLELKKAEDYLHRARTGHFICKKES